MSELKLDNQTKYQKIAECEYQNRKFIIAINVESENAEKKVLELYEDGSIIECSNDDPVMEFFNKYIQPSKSLDIE